MTGIENKELLAYVLDRLADDDADSDNNDPNRTASPEAGKLIHVVFTYGYAKDEARKGNFAPLLKFLTELTGDPELANLIAGKRQPRQRKMQGMTPIKLKAYRERRDRAAERRDRANAVKRIRELIKEKIGKQPSRALLSQIAGEVLQCDPKIILKTIDRGI